MNKRDLNVAADFRIRGDIGRRDFLRYTLGSFAVVSTGAMTFGCGGNDTTPVKPYLIDSSVKTTAEYFAH